MVIFFFQKLNKIENLGVFPLGMVLKRRPEDVLKIGMKAKINGKIVEVVGIEYDHMDIKVLVHGQPALLVLAIKDKKKRNKLGEKTEEEINEEENLLKDCIGKEIEFS